MNTENKVLLRVHEFDCTIEDITNALGIEPTKSWLKGDIIPNRKGDIKRSQSTWEYQTKLDQKQPIEEHIQTLLGILMPLKNTLKQLSEKFETELAIVIYEYDSCNPGFSLDSDIVKKISELGLIVDVDIYVLDK